MDRVTKRLRVELSPEEKDAKGKLLAKLCFDMGDLEEQKKAASASYASQIKSLKANNSSVAYDVRTGTEERVVECQEIPRWREGIVDLVRLDTHAVVDKRPLTAEEKQQRFDLFSKEDDEADESAPGAH